MAAFFSGMITMGFVIGGLFFLKFWRKTGDRLFAAFALAFWLFALNQGLISIGAIAREEQSLLYLLRLAGFAALIVAIAFKNLERPEA